MAEFTEADRAEVEAARVQRDETLQERRADEWINEGNLIPTADPYGPDSQDVLTALGHWADWDLGTMDNTNGADAVRKKHGGDADAGEMLDKRLAANAIRNHYMVTNRADHEKLKNYDIENNTELDLSSADSRIAVLDNLVQNTASDQAGAADPKYAESTCASSSLVGAALIGGKEKGTEGITNLLDAMSQDPERKKFLEGDKENPGVLSDIRAKIASGESLTTGDMHLLQRTLYNELQASESKDASARLDAINADPNATDEDKAKALQALTAATDHGIRPETLQNFIDGAPGLKTMMKENEMSVSYIHNDPYDKAGTHAVLTIGNGREGGPHTIYDPQMRDDGQIVMQPSELEHYQTAQKANIAPS